VKPGDIVLIRFPQTNLTPGNLRPALVLAVTPGDQADLLLAMITSRVYQAVPALDEIIAPSDADYPISGLKARSVVRLTRLATITPAVINARLGQISPSRLRQMRNRLSDWLRAG
jgi:mRNA interferase MazF